MEKPKRSSQPSHRRFESLDVKRSSSSLNMSTSSLRSINEEDRGAAAAHAGRRPTVVRFAPTPTPPRPSSSSGTRRGSRLAPQQAPKARPATAAVRPASPSGTRPARSSPAESGPKATRRSWGCTGSAGDQKERVTGDVISGERSKGAAATLVRSSSVPRSRKPAEEKPLQKRESKTNIISRTKQRPTPSPKPDVLHKPGAQRSPSIAAKTSEKRPPTPGGASPDDMVKVSPPRSTSATTMGASWESLPPALQTLGSGVMSYRDAAEMAAVEAMQEASAAEIVLRCLSAFADLAATAGKQSPQHTVDEFLALQAAITRSTAALGNQQRSGHAGEWLHAAVTADLAPFSLYTASSSSRKRGTESPAVSASPRRRPPPGWRPRRGSSGRRSDVAGTLGQLKRVNDWLDDVGLRTAAVDRLKEKIFGYLLDHVESAVVALNGGVASNRRK
ncbi:serine/arginine repetitive matrix protein 2-like [Triticum dicoccoides]|uniref:serine/arginine repetitive matrix protein 2-like n=1 Tax=Triticum dicoccoides TaxID=85692 RepID=UPI00189096E7|nr:serine/arginine repetitive matrix protein 2-like [Triticum dicoccoides]